MSLKITHVGFSDESNWNVGRFRSLGLVTAPRKHLSELERGLSILLSNSGLTEFKWKKLRGAREQFVAEKICKFVIDHACAKKLRVDVLIWDIQDRRHNIRGRDDIENLQRMYYHLFRNVLRKRCPNDEVWCLYPDEHTAMNWQSVQDYLTATSTRIEKEKTIFTGGKFYLRIRKDFHIERIEEAKSQVHLLLQVADLFAGLAVFSRDKYKEYNAWLRTNSGQKALFDEDPRSIFLTRSSVARFQVLRFLDTECKRQKLGVSLEKKGGLWTPNPNNPINFWLYEPQHPEDRAPIKGRLSI